MAMKGISLSYFSGSFLLKRFGAAGIVENVLTKWKQKLGTVNTKMIMNTVVVKTVNKNARKIVARIANAKLAGNAMNAVVNVNSAVVVYIVANVGLLVR